MNNLSNTVKFNPFTKMKYLCLEIDGTNIGELIDKHLGKAKYYDLVPTFLDWLTDTDSINLVWKRAFPKNGESFNAPILMCSEDIDLWCDLIIAKVKFENYCYIWEDIGIEDGSSPELEDLGSEVIWLNIGPFVFSKENYTSVLNEYKVI